MPNFKRITHFDVTDLKNKVVALTDEWDRDVDRHGYLKNMRNGAAQFAHRNVKHIVAYNFPLDWRGEGYPSTKTGFIEESLYDLIDPIIEYLENYHDGRVGRCLLTKLAANSNIEPHEDPGFYLTHCRRCHVPLVTDERVVFTVGGEDVHMAEGTCYEIDNATTHSVQNSSAVDRIHLLVDIVPNSLICL